MKPIEALEQDLAQKGYIVVRYGPIKLKNMLNYGKCEWYISVRHPNEHNSVSNLDEIKVIDLYVFKYFPNAERALSKYSSNRLAIYSLLIK